MRFVSLALLLAACDSYDYGPYVDGSLWDATGMVATSDAAYVRLPHSGDVVKLTPDGVAEPLGVAPYRVDALEGSGTAHLLARSSAVRCEGDAPVFLDLVEACPYEDQIDVAAVIPLGTDDATPVEIPAGYLPFTFSADGRWAVAARDPDASVVGGGLQSLASLLVLDLDSGGTQVVPVGFAATEVLYMEDDLGVASGMLVLSRSEVAMYRFTDGVVVSGPVYPLVLDADTELTPRDVVLTPDGDTALLTLVGQDDLYALDLVDPSINLLSLPSEPSDLWVDVAGDRTFVTYGRLRQFEIIDHALFDSQSFTLDEPATDIVAGDGFVLLWSRDGGRDVVHVDLDTLRQTEIRLNFVPEALVISPDATFAMAHGFDGVNATLELLDLRPVDGDVDDESRPFLLDGRVRGIAFQEDADSLSALLLLDGQDSLFELSWPSLLVDVVDLPSPPVAIGSLVDGPFFIAHTDPLGLVSFYTPGEELVTVSGFATFGLDDPETLLVEEEE